VKLLVGFRSGSSADLWVRGFAPFLERHLKKVQVSVVNRVGEGGLAVARDLADARTDGSVIGYAATPFLLARMVERNATALLQRLRFLATVTEEPVVLVAPPGTDLAALRAQRGNQPLALPPPVSAAAVAAAQIEGELPLAQLHFPSAAAARQAAISGHVAGALLTLPEAILAVREGKLVVIGIAAPAHHPQFPDAPTLNEAGLPLEASLQRGIMVPVAIAEEAAAEITQALRAAAADPEFLAQAEALGILPHVRDEADWRGVIQRDLATLRRRWETAPWQVSGG
jgi:tripartite-type tricarboxylate transporter receptor subunit TctC